MPCIAMCDIYTHYIIYLCMNIWNCVNIEMCSWSKNNQVMLNIWCYACYEDIRCACSLSIRFVKLSSSHEIPSDKPRISHIRYKADTKSPRIFDEYITVRVQYLYASRVCLRFHVSLSLSVSVSVYVISGVEIDSP